MTTVLLHLLVSFSLFAATAPPPSPSPPNCSDELVRLSVCLPHISSYPNNLTRLPSSQCCHDVASAVISGTAVCLCYLIRQPLMLGFPLNSTRLLSLATLCRVKDRGNETISSLDSLCSGSPILPPLRSITGPDGHPEQHSPSGKVSDGPSKQSSGSPILPPLRSITGPDNHPEQHSPSGKGSDGPSKQNSGPNNTARPSSCSEATNNTEALAPVPESMPTPADDYFQFEAQHAPAANIGTQPSLSASFARYNSKWRWFIPQIMILASHLSTYR